MAYIPLLQRNPSTKPTYAVMGAGAKINDPKYPPSPLMPSADEYNEIGGSTEAAITMCDLATIQMTNTAGVYSKVAGKCINTTFVLGATLATGDVIVTKNGTGDLTFEFAVGKIPTIQFPPVLSFNHSTAHTRSYNSSVVDGRTVRVMMYNANVAAEALFTLYVKLCLYFRLLLHLE